MRLQRRVSRRTLLRGMATAPLAAMLLAACGEPDPSLSTPRVPAGAGPSGSILFVAGGNINNWNGSVNTLTSGFKAAFPSWSPAGDRFAYVKMSDAFSELYVADRSGKELQKLTNNEPADAPYTEAFAFNAAWAVDAVWSPTNDQIAFISDKGGLDPYSDIMYLWFAERWDVQADPYPLLAAQSIDHMQASPSFSPDGNQIAFVVRVPISDTVRSTQLWAMDLNGGAYRTLVDGSLGAAYKPAWSPTGDNIAYVQRTGTSDDIWIVPAHDGGPYQLTHLGTLNAPVWSPDGRFLAFFREQDGNFEAWYADVTLGADRHVTIGEPKKLFSADNIDAPSGMSWTAS